MTFTRALALAVLFAGALGCGNGRSSAPTKAPPQNAEATAAVKNGARRIDIAITDKGYEPANISAKAGEKLVLVFSRPADLLTCAGTLKIVGRAGEIEVPEGGSVAVPFTVPAGAAQISFACTMDMFHGVITVN